MVADAVITGEEVSNRAVGVWNADGIKARAIVRPSSTDEVSAILKECYVVGQSVVTHGGRTGLVDGQISRDEDIVLSLERMTKIEAIDPAGRTMTVQSGVPLQIVQEAALAENMVFPVDLGARGSCTIGGNISTNAGGNQVIRYGMVRENILGLEAVMADGTIISSMNKMIKNNSGYDIKQLFIGSEGTLGIVTRAVLRLREQSRSQSTALMALDDFSKVMAFLKFVDRELAGTLSAFEVMWADFYEVTTTEPATCRPPIDHGYPYYIIVESIGGDQEKDSERFQEILMQAFEDGLLQDVIVAKSQSERNEIWEIRDGVEHLHQFGLPILFDVSLQLVDMENYIGLVKQRIDQAWPDNRCFIFGHLGDGNLHFNISVGDTSEATVKKIKSIVYEPLKNYNGAISAEHGVGLEKKPYLSLSRSDEEINLMRTLKKALDSKGILNPGKIFDL